MKTSNRDLINSIKSAIRQPFAWPGGYPISLITSDCAAICPSCARKHWRSVLDATRNSLRDGWQVTAATILWEGDNHCDHCNANLDAYPAE